MRTEADIVAGKGPKSSVRKTRRVVPAKAQSSVAGALVADVRRLIDEARSAVAQAVNAGLCLLYWRVGKRINDEILQGNRAEYGQQILATLSQELAAEYGSGFNYSALTRMARFAEVFPDEQIVATLSRQSSWSHFKELLPPEKPLQTVPILVPFSMSCVKSPTRILNFSRERARRFHCPCRARIS